MKQFLYLIICIVVLGIGSLFVLKSPTGKPWLKTADFVDPQAISSQLSSVKNNVSNKVQSLLRDDSDPEIYKWQDAQGVWHYSDSKNADSKTWIKPNNLTVIPAIEPLKKENVTHTIKGEHSTMKTVELSTPSSRVDKIKNLMNDTNNVQELMNNRTKVIDKQLSQ